MAVQMWKAAGASPSAEAVAQGQRISPCVLNRKSPETVSRPSAVFVLTRKKYRVPGSRPAVLRYGGRRRYRQVLPLFFEMIMGQSLGGCVGPMIGLIFSMPSYNSFRF